MGAAESTPIATTPPEITPAVVKAEEPAAIIAPPEKIVTTPEETPAPAPPTPPLATSAPPQQRKRFVGKSATMPAHLSSS